MRFARSSSHHDQTSPFYRVTYLSNYSPHIAPPGHHSLLSETSYSPYKREDAATIVFTRRSSGE